MQRTGHCCSLWYIIINPILLIPQKKQHIDPTGSCDRGETSKMELNQSNGTTTDEVVVVESSDRIGSSLGTTTTTANVTSATKPPPPQSTTKTTSATLEAESNTGDDDARNQTTIPNTKIAVKLDRPPKSLLQVVDDEVYCRKRKAATFFSSDHHQEQKDDKNTSKDDDIVDSTNATDVDKSTSNNNNNNNNSSAKSVEASPWKIAQELKHFAGQPLPVKKDGLCAECGLDEEAGDIVLCDGLGCDQEFHLQCCRPPIQVIPDGDFYCFYCSQEGSTESLEAYLDQVENQREDYYCFESSYGSVFGGKSKLKVKGILLDHFKKNRSVSTLRRGDHTSLSSTNPFMKNLYVGVLQGLDDLIETNGTDEARNSKESKDQSVSSSSYAVAKSKKRSTSGKPSSKSSSSPTRKLDFVDCLLLRDMVFQHAARFIKGGNKAIAALRNKDSTTTASKKTPSKKGPQPPLPTTVLDVTPTTLRVLRSEIQDRYCFSDDLNDLIGKPLKLYCPTDGQYHTGRILTAQRPIPPALNDEDVNIETPKKKPASSSMDIECLVRFGAGLDYRKKAITRWIRLEEHSVLVAQDCIWGRKQDVVNPTASSSKSGTGTINNIPVASLNGGKNTQQVSNDDNMHWARGMLWIKSSRELVNGMGALKESLGQIKFRPLHSCDGLGYINGNKLPRNPSMKQRRFGLLEFWGHPGTMNLIDISQETVEEGTKSLLAFQDDNNLGRVDKPPILISREGRIALALEKTEFEEQTRVRRWAKDHPIANPLRLTSTSHDEYIGGELSIFDKQSDSTEKTPSSGIDQTPLVRTGVDRLFLLDQLMKTSDGHDNNKKSRSRDVALSMTCSLDDSRPMTSFVQALNQQHRPNPHQS